MERLHSFCLGLDRNDAALKWVEEDHLLLVYDFPSESDDGDGCHMLNSRAQLQESVLFETEWVLFGLEGQHTVVIGEV